MFIKPLAPFADRSASPAGMASRNDIVPAKIVSGPLTKSPVLSMAPKLQVGIPPYRQNFEINPYNLEEIVRAEETEMYISRSFLDHVQLIMREGYAVKSRGQWMEEWANLRLKEIEILTTVSFTSLLREIAFNLVRFCNAFIIKVRKDYPGSAKMYTWQGVQHKPIVGLFCADPQTMSIVRDASGRPQYYRQYVERTGLRRIWPAYNVIHLYYNKKTGAAFGSPWIVPVLDDVRLLRRIEEQASILANNFAQPFIHWKIGTDERPASVDPRTGESEVIKARNEYRTMPQEGVLITDHRHAIDPIKTAVSGVDISPYLEYFAERVVAGVGLSGVALGQGGTANKSTATQITQVAINRCKDIQEVVADFITNTLLFEFVLDSGKRYEAGSAPYLEFTEIDVESQRARETHALNIYQGGGITHAELRHEQNRNPFKPEDEAIDFTGYTERRKMELEGAISKKYGLNVKTKPTSGAAKSKSQPTNQHEIKLTKTKIKANDAKNRLYYESFMLQDYILSNKDDNLNKDRLARSCEVFLDKVGSGVHTCISSAIYAQAASTMTRLSDKVVADTSLEMMKKHLFAVLTSGIRDIVDKNPQESPEKMLAIINNMNENASKAIDEIFAELEEEEVATESL